MIAITIPFSLSGLAGPAVQGLISNQVPQNAQGELQGGLMALMSVTAIIGPLLMTHLFSRFTAPSAMLYFPGMPFLTSFVLVMTGILVLLKPLSRIHT